MVLNDGQMQRYEEYLKEKEREFQDAQADVSWLMLGLGCGLKKVGEWLVIWGQTLQTNHADMHLRLAAGTRPTHHTI